jgi:DNA polymerase-3 subunit gamma/tau
MERLCDELLGHLRNLLILLTVGNPRDFLLCTDEDLELYRAQAGLCAAPQLLGAMETLEQAAANLRRSADRRMEMELSLIKLCTGQKQEGGAQEASALEKRVAALEQQVKLLQAQPNRPAPAAAKPSPTPPAPLSPAPGPPPPVPDGEDRLFAEWALVLEQLREGNPPLAGILGGSTAFIRGDFVLIKSDNPALGSFLNQPVQAASLKEAIRHVTDRKVRLGPYKSAAKDEAAKDPLAMLARRQDQLTTNNGQWEVPM